MRAVKHSGPCSIYAGPCRCVYWRNQEQIFARLHRQTRFQQQKEVTDRPIHNVKLQT